MRSYLLTIFLILLLPVVTAIPQITEIDGDAYDARPLIVNGDFFGDNQLLIETLGGKYGAIESIQEGTTPHIITTEQPNPEWTAQGWSISQIVGDEERATISSERPYSHSQSIKHYCNGRDLGCYISPLIYKPSEDPEMPLNKFDEVWFSSWVYFDPIWNNKTDETQWKFLYVKSAVGGNEWEGDILSRMMWQQNADGSFRMQRPAISFYPVDEHRTDCQLPCGGPLTCKQCGWPGPLITNNQAELNTFKDGFELTIRDSYNQNMEPMPILNGRWFRADVYARASSEFDTWDGAIHFRIRDPVANKNWYYRMENIATHGSNPLLDPNETLVPDVWDNVYDNVQWKNQITKGHGIANVFYDDHFIQFSTPARVEICNNQDYDVATICEVQYPTSWNNNQIILNMNYGQFQENDDVYLFVIDDNQDPSTGQALTLGRRTESTLLYSAMGSDQEIYSPTIHQTIMPSINAAVPGSASGELTYETGTQGNGARFNGDGTPNRLAVFEKENFDINDLGDDGGRIDFQIKYQRKPNTITENVWVMKADIFPRLFDVEFTDTDLNVFVYNTNTPPNAKTTDSKFRVSTRNWDLWDNLAADEWHSVTITWRRNGPENHNAELHLYVNGQQQGCEGCNDYGGILPDVRANMEISPALYSNMINFVMDELYSFKRWDLSDAPAGTYANLPNNDRIDLAYPYQGAQAVRNDGSFTDAPNFEFIPYRQGVSEYNCNLLIDGIQRTSKIAINALYNKIQSPIYLSPGQHTYQIICDGIPNSEIITFSINSAGVTQCQPGEVETCPETVCAQERICGTDFKWGACVDKPNDGCPIEGEPTTYIFKNGESGYNGQIDACIKSGNADQNYVSESCQIMRNYERQLFKFDLSLIPPGQTIESATLTMTEIPGDGKQAGGVINFLPVTKNWQATTTTWNCADDNDKNGDCLGVNDNPWTSPGVRADTLAGQSLTVADGATIILDVTNWTQEWYQNENNGFLVEMNYPSSSCCFTLFGNGQQSNSAHRPTLTVTVADNQASPLNEFDLAAPYGEINLLDLAVLATNFGSAYYRGDYDNDGKITIIDIITHINNWN